MLTETADEDCGHWSHMVVLGKNPPDIHVWPCWGRSHTINNTCDCWCSPYADPDEPRVKIHHPSDS